MDFRDFEITDCGDEIIISQNREDDFVDKIYLNKKQLQFFIESLIGKESLTIGYVADINFKNLSETLKILVDTPEELGKLHKDINMNGFGLECEIECAERIVYKWED